MEFGAPVEDIVKLLGAPLIDLTRVAQASLASVAQVLSDPRVVEAYIGVT